MIKGNVYPQARARWMITDYNFARHMPPVWAYAEQFGALFIGEVDGLPVPLIITQDDMTPGLWRYNPDTGTIIWKGTWSILTLDGEWFFRQRNNGTEFMDLTLTMDYFNGFIHQQMIMGWTIPQSRGLWSPAADLLVELLDILHIDYPWIAAVPTIWKPMTYSQLRLQGIDPDNTEPATWTSDL